MKKEIVNKLALSWNQTGLEKGDTVLIHSSLSRILKTSKLNGIDLTPQDILDAFIECVGSQGTLIFPTFNFDFTKGLAFDIRNTKSETGILTEMARLHPHSVRTGHPLFSFAVIGYHKKKFTQLYNFSAFGTDSPFAKLLELEGKIAVLDLKGEICMTFYHYVEEMENARHRYHKIFKGPYIDYDGVIQIKEFDLYARNLKMKVETDIKSAEEHIWSQGLYSGYRPGDGNSLHLISARTVYDQISNIIKEGSSLGMLYRIGNRN